MKLGRWVLEIAVCATLGSTAVPASPEHSTPSSDAPSKVSEVSGATAAARGQLRRPVGESVVQRGSIQLRGTSPGPANLLPTFQIMADYPQAETMGFPHFGNRATNVVRDYNASELCDDTKRPRDVCSPPPLDTNPSTLSAAGNGAHVTRYLPHLMRNQYRSERVAESMPTLVLSDGTLRVDVVPQYGGKVYAMTHLPTNTSLLHSPVTRQPIQSARLGAQVDGGIEWNWSPGMLGHWVGTQRDVFAATLQTSRGPALRIYDYDRWNDTFFQVDMIVYNGTFFAHPKVWNPNSKNVTGYWWTCTGTPFTTPDGNNCKSSPGNPGTRVLNPAAYVVDDTLEAKPWPHLAGQGGNPPNETNDMSFLSSWITGNDNFLRVLRPTKPHITVVDRDLYGAAVGLYHGHRLNGSKFWTGGRGGNSQRWYDWKDAPPSPTGPDGPPSNGGGCGDCGCFFEPQVGVGPTQARGFPLPASTTREWTHAWRPLASLHESPESLADLYSSNHTAALRRIEAWSESSDGVPDVLFNSMETFFTEEVSRIAVSEADVLHVGTPYGALHEGMIGERMTPTMLFSVAPMAAPEVAPWLDLLVNGTFSSATLAEHRIPQSYMTTAQWEARLEHSVKAHGATFLHLLHLGVIAAERLDIPRAITLTEQSVADTPTAVGHRNLAVFYKDPAVQWRHFQKAWTLALAPAPGDHGDPAVRRTLIPQLAGEIALFGTTVSALVDARLTNATSLWRELGTFLADLHHTSVCSARGLHCDHDMVAFAAMFMGYSQGDADGCRTALDVLRHWVLGTDAGNSYVFSRSPYLQPRFNPLPNDGGRSVWAVCIVVEAEAKLGRKLTPAERNATLAANPPPYWLGFALS